MEVRHIIICVAWPLQAVQFKQSHKIKDAPPFTSDCAQLGSCYGVGIGLYFQIISWLRMLLLWLALASVSNHSWYTTMHCRTVELKSCKHTKHAHPSN